MRKINWEMTEILKKNIEAFFCLYMFIILWLAKNTILSLYDENDMLFKTIFIF